VNGRDPIGLMGQGVGGSGGSSRINKGNPCSGGPRMPDFINFQIDAYVGSFWGTFTRDGSAFIGGGINMGIPSSLSLGGSISLGWINSVYISPGQADGFADGFAGGGAAAFAGIGGGFIYSPGNGTATILGVGASIISAGNNNGSAGWGYSSNRGATGLGGWGRGSSCE